MIKIIADFITTNLLLIPPQSFWFGVVSYFIYDTVKILLLLMVIIFAVSFLRSFLPKEKIRNILAKRNLFGSHLLAGLFGVITPFCSCSAVPLFLGFVEAGVPLGVTFTFLVSSPMVNEVALILLFGMFGWKIAAIYFLSGLAISIISGLIIGKFNPESFIHNLTVENKKNCNCAKVTWKMRVHYAWNYTVKIIKKVWIYVILGVAAGAFVHGFVPIDFLVNYAGADKWYAVPLAVLIGIPLYSNAAGVIPLVSALAEKGMAIGTALALMMSVTALSFPEFVILKKIMKVKLIVFFAAVVGAGIVLVGYLLNWVIK